MHYLMTKPILLSIARFMLYCLSYKNEYLGFLQMKKKNRCNCFFHTSFTQNIFFCNIGLLMSNMFSLPTPHILKLGRDHLALLFDTQGTPLVSFFDLQGPQLFSGVCLNSLHAI